jgi:hypothetical protein
MGWPAKDGEKQRLGAVVAEVEKGAKLDARQKGQVEKHRRSL